MTALETLPGIGTGLAAELRAAGIRDQEALRELGPAEAARRVGELGFRDTGALHTVLTTALGGGPAEPALDVLGIDNVLFAVGDLDAAMVHYAERLGLPVTYRLPEPRVALLRLGDEAPGLLLREEPRLAEAPPRAGAQRVWLEVPDAAAAATRLRAAGVTLLAEPFPVATGVTVEVADAWGNVVGFTDHTAASERARRPS